MRYPFTAIVHQETVKTALTLNAVIPTIGGVLISGPKGSGKSILVKSFSEVLPEIKQVSDCPFHCNPNDPTNMCLSCLTRFETGERFQTERVTMKMVHVPLSVTDDMLVGSIDLDKAVKEGIKSLRPGLLAEANQNILYIDEVNLLPDHITDSILDAAASGWNTVEREGISVQHPSRFILVGTMNPEEGELRPQILDRFGVYAETKNIGDPNLRTLVIKRNEDYTADPYFFIKKFHDVQTKLRDKIEAARSRISEVEVPKEIYSMISKICSNLKVDGFRPDIVGVKVARALAALQGKSAVSVEEVAPSMELTLGHRTRRSGMAPPPSLKEIHGAVKKAEKRTVLSSGSNITRLRGIFNLPSGVVDNLIRKARRSFLVGVLFLCILIASITYSLESVRNLINDTPPTPLTLFVETIIGIVASILITLIPRRGRRKKVSVGTLDLSEITIEAAEKLPTPHGVMEGPSGTSLGKVTFEKDSVTTPEYGFKILKPMDNLQKSLRENVGKVGRPLQGRGYGRGRRIRAISSLSKGRYAWYRTPKGKPKDIALIPTIKAAALHQPKRESTFTKLSIEREDFREKVREYHAPFSMIILLDMSLSMIQSMENVIQAIYSLHKNVYRRRDRVGLIVFKGSKAFVIQHPTSNLNLVVEKLRKVGASDFTPLAKGLQQALKSLKQEKLKNKDVVPTLILISDGITNVPLDTPLSMLTRRKYTSEAQADSFDVARLIAKGGFRVHIINTNHREEEAAAFLKVDDGYRLRLTPTQFLIELARFSNGNYLGLSLEENNLTPDNLFLSRPPAR